VLEPTVGRGNLHGANIIAGLRRAPA